MKEFLTKNFMGIIVLVLAAIIYLQRGNNDATGTQKPDTTTKTVYITQPPVYIPMYVPAPSNSQTPIIIPPNYKPSEDSQKLLEQYKELVNKFLTQNTYKDSIELKDTAGNKVGIVNLEDVVSENVIKSRKPSYQLNLPHTTITIREPYKLKNQVYIGGGVLGNQNQLISGAKAGIFLKNKKDQLYGVEIQKQIGVPITYSTAMYWKLRLGKK